MKIDQKLEIEKLLQLPVVDRPRRIAELVHRIQVDKAGRAYIDHPRRVAENVQQFPGFDRLPSQEQSDAVAAAWLHDVIEDSGDEAWPKVTQADLVGWGISERAAEIAELLTRNDDVTDDIYYARIKADPLARLVKIADIVDNCNEQRIAWVVAAGGKRNPARYAHAFEVFELTADEKRFFSARTTKPANYLTLKEGAMTKGKTIVYLDMDDVIVDFKSGIDAVKWRHPFRDPKSHKANWDEVPGIFSKMKPYAGAIDAVKRLAQSEHLDVYVLSTAPWQNPSAWADKLRWIREHFDEKNPIDTKTADNPLYKKLILSHNKHLNSGEILIDDRKANGAADFGGLHIHFGPESKFHDRPGKFPNWDAVLHYFEKEGLLEKQGE
jgi:5'(3')-deoxyribonucleotidase